VRSAPNCQSAYLFCRSRPLRPAFPRPPRFADELAASFGDESDALGGRRPPLPAGFSSAADLSFQWVDIDNYEGEVLREHPAAHSTGQNLVVPGARKGAAPILRLFGVTGDGHSVLAHVHGFTPYFWASPPHDFREEHLAGWQAALEGALAGARSKSRVEQAVLAVQLVPEKQSLLGFYFGRRQNMLKIFMALPSMISAARGTLERGFSAPGVQSKAYMCFEAALPYPMRYMIDRDIVGCNWCSVKGGTYLLRGDAAGGGGAGAVRGSSRISSVQIEIDVVFDSLVSHAPEGEWQRVAPLRILSFDIECMGRKGCFPEAEQDPVIQIASVVTVQGARSSIVRNVFTLGSCSSIVGADVRSCATEEEMLRAWAAFVRDVDPDVITGYNVQNFDIPYVLNRCRKLKVEDGQILGRIKGVKATMRDTTFQSSAHGKRENVETQIDGRVVFDMLVYIRRDHKLSSYSLNSVSAHFLGQQKEDVHHSIIADLQRGTPDDRRRLATYCLKDAFLPQRLCDKLMVIINHIEMSRVTGVPLDYLLSRGQQIKVVSMLLRKCKPLGLLMPTIARTQGGDEDVNFEGATVIEPIRGYYDEPIATLDFASLYPSIMQAHNLCYSTLLGDKADVSKLDAAEYEKTPDEEFYFVRSSVQKGVLPMILDELLAARKRAKKDMAAATDPFVVAVQNGRQLALKISANSVYGFTGATVGMLPCLPISASVTAYGRHMIADTKKAVETRFTIANGYPADAVVVYGDTDSVMVKFGVRDVERSMKLGAEASREVTKLFPPPVKLEFEKVYFPFLLMNKKRYAGLYWSKPDAWDKMDTKGIETVRRDNCEDDGAKSGAQCIADSPRTCSNPLTYSNPFSSPLPYQAHWSARSLTLACERFSSTAPSRARLST
jgi:DNA polymerase delta subunit 1